MSRADDRQRLLDKAESAAAMWCQRNGHSRRTLAGLAGHPTAILQHYGTRFISHRVATDILAWLDDDRRQLKLPFGFAALDLSQTTVITDENGHA